MTSAMTIGHFARVTGIPVRTLRFYADAGLLPPATTDPQTGYRYYAPSQVRTARLIVVLRGTDMPLRDIAACLDGARPDLVRQALDRQRTRLHERIRADTSAIETLDRLLREEPSPMYDVQITTVPATLAVVVRTRVQRVEDVAAEVVRAFTKDLWPLVERQGLQPTLPYFFACHDLEGEGGPADLEMVVPVQGHSRPEGRVDVATVPGGRFASTLHAGSYGTMGAAYRAVLEWTEQAGLPLPLAGQTRETYLVDWRATDHEADLRTQIMYALR